MHAKWVHDHIEGYCVASEEVAARLADKGVARENIHVTGIPIASMFGQPLVRETCAREIGIDPARMTLLMMSGGVGLAGAEKLAERLLKLPADFKIVALAGRNAELLAQVRVGALACAGEHGDGNGAEFMVPLGVYTPRCAATDIRNITIFQESRFAGFATGFIGELRSKIPMPEPRNAGIGKNENRCV